MSRSALVTGAASGLGAAVLARLRADGYEVVGLDLREAPGVLSGDVTSAADVEQAVAAAGERAPLRAVVTCAGVAIAERLVGRDGPHDLDRFRRVVDVNLIGTFNALRLGAAAMAATSPDAEGQRGAIVCTASVAAFEGQIGQAAYAASKGGVAALVLPAARDLARSGIRVVGIAPGLFDTPLLAGLPAPARTALEATVPNPARLGRPSEFADLVAHVLANPMLNGETIRLDGALRMAPR
jgi:NAD(P)-dependent dehydrogenase (short-subunit alcohol dehydrogenase family)